MSLIRPRRVAVVRLEGVIGAAVRASDFVPLFDQLRHRRRIRAVVLEIDSRGGSASVSDYIYESVAALNAVKPVIAFCGNICASGGYLIACGARSLLVQPGAVVGSIGVISVRPLAEDLMRRLGLDVAVTKSGRLKDMGAPWRRPTDEEEAKEKALVDEYFNLFLDRIEQGRRMQRERIRELATGEVFSGRQAVDAVRQVHAVHRLRLDGRVRGAVPALGELQFQIAELLLHLLLAFDQFSHARVGVVGRRF